MAIGSEVVLYSLKTDRVKLVISTKLSMQAGGEDAPVARGADRGPQYLPGGADRGQEYLEACLRFARIKESESNPEGSDFEERVQRTAGLKVAEVVARQDFVAGMLNLEADIVLSMEVLREMLAQIFEGNAPACQAVGELLVERSERLKQVQQATDTEPWRMVADAITQSIKGATVKEDPMSEGNAFVKRLQQIQAVHQPKVFDISQHDRDGLEKWTDHLLTFVQHVDPAAKGLCDLIQHLKWCTYPTGMYSSEERYQESFQQGGVLTRNLAEQNFLDLQYQLLEGAACIGGKQLSIKAVQFEDSVQGDQLSSCKVW